MYTSVLRVTNEQRNKNLHRHETQRQRLYGEMLLRKQKELKNYK